jgi:gliding motility-associated-like protein
MKKILSLCCLLVISYSVLGSHIIGGQIYYQYLGQDLGNPGFNRYTITLKLYREVGSNPLPATIGFRITSTDGLFIQDFLGVGMDAPPQPVGQTLSDPCVSSTVVLSYEFATYSQTVSLEETKAYTVASQYCCRRTDVTNANTASGMASAIYSCSIPTQIAGVPNAPDNTSPIFATNDATLVCANRQFQFDFSAQDRDGDQLTYYLCDAYGNNPGNNNLVSPPFTALSYNFPYSSAQPMGAGVNINSFTGILSGIAPSAGRYIVAVCCEERRNGILISTARKEFQIQVSDQCNTTEASVPGNSALGDGAMVNCKDLSIHFSNASIGTIADYFWNFGDLTTLADTSHAFEPTYTYPVPGTYIVQLIVSNASGCSDDTTIVVRVYPRFDAGFKVAGSCVTAPFTFTDTSKNTTGSIINREWDFGEPTVTTDVGSTTPITYTYPATGTKNARLIVTNSVGCKDTAYRTVIVVDKPLIDPSPRDTTICSLDTITIRTNTGIPGTYLWTPNYMISSTSVASPRVSPDVTTKYYVSFNNGAGCSNTDSATVTVRNSVNINIANNDSTICLNDIVQLNASHDGTGITWSPSTPSSGLSATNIINPTAKPQVQIKYYATANIGSCTKKDSVTITPIPVPVADIVNADTSFCFGNSKPLFAGGGSIYQWSPSTNLDDATIFNPVVTPSSPGTTVYTVTVGDVLGCPKTTTASISITASAGITANAGRDTVVIANQPYQINAGGGQYYEWSPPDHLSATDIPNPVAVLDQDFTYYLKISNDAGCVDYDTLNLTIFKGRPDIYVPSVFSPNGDGINDAFRPICVGVREMYYFRIFDRYGKILFNSKQCDFGWSGLVHGNEMPQGTYVFVTEGIAILGNRIYHKGSFLLLR